MLTLQVLQQGLKALNNRVASHRRSGSRPSNVSGSEGETSWSFPEEHDSNDDSGIVMGINGSRRTSNGGGAPAPWQETILRPQDDQRQQDIHQDAEAVRQHQPLYHPLPQVTLGQGSSPYPSQGTLGQETSPYHSRENGNSYHWSPRP